MLLGEKWVPLQNRMCVLRQNEVRYWPCSMDFCCNFQRDSGRATAFGMQVLIATILCCSNGNRWVVNDNWKSSVRVHGVCQGDERRWTIDEASLAKLASHIRIKVFSVFWDNARGSLFTVCWVCGVEVAWTWHRLIKVTGEIDMEC